MSDKDYQSIHRVLLRVADGQAVARDTAKRALRALGRMQGQVDLKDEAERVSACLRGDVMKLNEQMKQLARDYNDVAETAKAKDRSHAEAFRDFEARLASVSDTINEVVEQRDAAQRALQVVVFERDTATRRADAEEARATRLEAADAAWQRALRIEQNVADNLRAQVKKLAEQKAVVEVRGPASVRTGNGPVTIVDIGSTCFRNAAPGDRVVVELGDGDVRQALHVLGQALGVRP